MIKIEPIEITALKKISNANILTKLALHKWFFQFGQHLKRSAIKEVRRKPRHGVRRLVRNPISGVRFWHTASTAGETPANMFGNYQKGLGFKIAGSQMVFGDTVSYARALELGTKGNRANQVVTNRKRILGSFKSTGGIPTPNSAGKSGGISPRPGLALAIAANERNAARDAKHNIEISLGTD